MYSYILCINVRKPITYSISSKYLQHLHLVDSFGSYTILHDASYSYDLETNLISARKFYLYRMMLCYFKKCKVMNFFC